MGIFDILGEIVKLPLKIVEDVVETAEEIVDDITGN